MQNIPKHEYTTEFKERAVKRVKDGKSIGLVGRRESNPRPQALYSQLYILSHVI